MRTFKLTITLCLIIWGCATNLHAQNNARKGLEAGVYAGAQYSVNPEATKINNLRFSRYNGGELGVYLSYQRRRIKLSTHMSVKLTDYNFKYQSDKIPDFIIDYKQALLIANKTYDIGIIVVQQPDYEFVITPSVNMVVDFNNKQKRETTYYTYFYDSTLQRENSRISGYARKATHRSDYRVGFGLSGTYQTYGKYAWFITAQVTFFAKVQPYTNTIVAYDRVNPSLPEVYKIKDNPLTFQLLFGWRFWHTYKTIN